MNTNKFFLVLTIIALGLFSASCSDEDTTLDSIKVEPHYWETNMGANSKQFRAIGHYSDGDTEDLTSEAHWSAGGLPVSGGMVIFNKSGNFTVTASHSSDASSGSVNGTASIKVNPAIQSLEINPAEIETTLGSDSVQLRVVGTYDDDTTTDLTREVSWSDDASPSLLSATVPGLVRFHTVQADPFQVTATYAEGTSYELANTISITVKKALKSIAIVLEVNTALIPDPTSDNTYNISAGSDPEQLYAIGTYTGDTTNDLTNKVVWGDDSASGTILSPDIDGFVYFDNVGRFVVFAYIDQTSDRILGRITLNIQ